MTTEQKLPRDHEAEQRLISCCMDWPERAAELLPMLEPSDFVDELHQRIWQRFKTQLWQTGEIDCLAAGTALGCCDYLIERAHGAPTTATAFVYAERVKLKARDRIVHELCQKGANAILQGRAGDVVAAQLELALSALKDEVAQ